jgi:hypothetical protein
MTTLTGIGDAKGTLRWRWVIISRIPYDGIPYKSPDANFNDLFDLDRDPDCRQNHYTQDQVLLARALNRQVNEMHQTAVPEEPYRRLGLNIV